MRLILGGLPFAAAADSGAISCKTALADVAHLFVKRDQFISLTSRAFC